MKQYELNATIRKTTGNGPARSLRRGGMFPAVIYGPSTQPILLAVNVRDFEHAVQKGNIRRTIFSLSIQNGTTLTKPAVIKEIQTHPVSGQFLHVDFYEIDMNRKLRVMVPLMPMVASDPSLSRSWPMIFRLAFTVPSTMNQVPAWAFS